MVQLQKDLPALEAAGVTVVAISYDSGKVLSSFAAKSKITFPLLSDTESKAIEAFGVLNKEAKAGRLKGIPYPGTFVIDQKGVIRAKLFLDGYRDRHSNDDLLKAVRSLK